MTEFEAPKSMPPRVWAKWFVAGETIGVGRELVPIFKAHEAEIRSQFANLSVWVETVWSSVPSDGTAFDDLVLIVANPAKVNGAEDVATIGQKC